MKVISEERYTFEFNDKTWTMYDKRDADYLDKQFKDAKRYQWLREHPAWETEAFLMGLTPELFDKFVDQAMS